MKEIERKRAGFLIFLVWILILLSLRVSGQGTDDIGGGIGIQITVIDNPDDPVPDNGSGDDGGSGQDNDDSSDDDSNDRDSNSRDDDYSQGTYNRENLRTPQRNEVVVGANNGRIELGFDEDIKDPEKQDNDKFVMILAFNSTLLLLLFFLLLLMSGRFTNNE